jgi:hypothetical protein
MKQLSAFLASAAVGLSILTSSSALAFVQPAGGSKPAPPATGAPAGPELITEDNVIGGTMRITFNTRTNKDASGDFKEGSPALGAKDVYELDMAVAKTTKFIGKITRQPNLFTRTLMRRKQDALLTYDIALAVLNPKDLKQSRNVGKWVGTVPIDPASGAYDLAGGKANESPLRIAVDAVGKAKAFTDNFAGRLVGKAEKKEGLASYTYKRVIGDKTVQITVKKSDPMRFENAVLAMGPSENYPKVVVNGRLDFDYETGNWYTDGLRFKYTVDGQETEDVVTGSIKWVEDADRKTSGKGYYDFNLRFNEDKNRKAGTEADAFSKMSDEEAFFAIDNSVPSLTGRVSYVDTMNGVGDDAVPVSSAVTYTLNANKLTKQQVMNFFKLWLIGIGPINDE